RWVATRTEDTQATGQSHGDAAEVELSANRDGTLRGLRVRLRHDVGAYGGPGLGQSDNILSHLVSAYRLPALDAESVLVYTSTVPTGFIRGGGRTHRGRGGLLCRVGWHPAARASHHSYPTGRSRPGLSGFDPWWSGPPHDVRPSRGATPGLAGRSGSRICR